jgi:FkbH-like protein
MNLRLIDNFKGDQRVVILDSSRWLMAAGPEVFSPKLWYMSKTPFHTTVFREVAQDTLAAIEGVHGLSKKVLVLDLDNTLWGGIVGEVGWERLRLGGHDPLGEAFLDFQIGLKQLSKRGILLAICSKNEEAVALDAIRRHPEMVLKLEDFAVWRINWQDKAQNTADLVSELNLGLDSVVFLDDSPFERLRVAEALPDVFVPDLPEDPMQYPSFLANLRCFDSPFISAEDRARTRMYAADQHRTALKNEAGSLKEWLGGLDLRVVAQRLRPENLERAAQLFNKTNQMNVGTRRLPAAELLAWSRAAGHALWTFRVSDKFGDYGLCGIGSLSQTGETGEMLDFLLSCRVMARGVEETMLHAIADQARQLSCLELRTTYLPTPKNRPCIRWLESQPYFTKEDHTFRLSLNQTPDLPRHVTLTLAPCHETINPETDV